MDNRLAEVENSLTAKIVALVNVETDKFRHEMTNKFSDLEERLSHVENVSSEAYTDAAITDRVNKVVESKVTDTVTETHKQIKEDIQRLSKTFNDTGDGLTLTVRKLPESTNKNVENKVNTMIQKGMKIQGVTVASAERKRAFRNGQSGVVIFQCRSHADRDTILANKARLIDCDIYKEVIVHTHKSKQQRQYEANMRTIVNTVAKNKLVIRGGRVNGPNERTINQRNERRIDRNNQQ